MVCDRSLSISSLFFIIYRLLRLHWDEIAARKRTEALLAMAEDDQRDGLRDAQCSFEFSLRVLAVMSITTLRVITEFAVTGGRRRNVRRRLQHQTDDFELIEREERKRREKEKEEKLERERERELEEEKLEQERLAKEKEAREKRELEEYLALKSSFAVEEEGFDQIEEEESNNLMEQFAEYVKTSKIVNMDELAAHFGLKSDEAITRLHYFLDNGFLQGVIDDRGKFICITDDELNADQHRIDSAEGIPTLAMVYTMLFNDNCAFLYTVIDNDVVAKLTTTAYWVGSTCHTKWRRLIRQRSALL
ncbi:unnamed protein product [Angiostrongylus costaricensis]|uniref:DDRGK domain-containing protein 1 n=1 Tax=Angiostrongylus costaricensis TaxID=334426 RepID=A0A0R3PJG5_ANGCS|nr:unnamed protein product [Angiostrongylus costaricensis]